MVSGRAVMPGSLSEQLLNLRLASSDPTSLTMMMDALGGKRSHAPCCGSPSKCTQSVETPVIHTQVCDSTHVFACADVLCNGPNMVHNFDSDVESKWWDCFAEVFLLEVSNHAVCVEAILVRQVGFYPLHTRTYNFLLMLQTQQIGRGFQCCL